MKITKYFNLIDGDCSRDTTKLCEEYEGSVSSDGLFDNLEDCLHNMAFFYKQGYIGIAETTRQGEGYFTRLKVLEVETKIKVTEL